MFLYTIVPIDEVLAGMDEERSFFTIRRGGLQMLVEPESGARGRIVRLFSTDPMDYLCPELQPGSVVNLLPDDFSPHQQDEDWSTSPS